MNAKQLTLFAAFGTALFAGGGGHGGIADTDIVPRTINFLIFAGLIWYLLAGVIKNFFAGRTSGIADEFEKIQAKLKEAKTAKEEARKKVEDAKKLADEIKETAEKETAMMVEKIKEQEAREIDQLKKQLEENMQVGRNQMVREVVRDTMGEILGGKEIVSENKELISTLLKKVA
jgi:F-type H+-transporting ATPase subunit b